MTGFAAVLATAILTALAVLQAAVASGAPLGRFVWGGQHRTLPPPLRVSSAASILLYAGFALVLLSRAGVLPGSDTGFVVVTAWLVFGFLALAVFGNLASRSKAERRTMVPTSAILAAAGLIVAAS